MIPTTRTAIAAMLLLSLATTSASAAAVKKWVDDKGQTHYGYTIPPEYVDHGHSELDEQGLERRRIDPALTPEEIEAEKARQAMRAEQRRLIEEQQARDRILLNLYRNEDDLVMARDGKIAQIDSYIGLKHSEIRRLKTRLSDFQAAAAAAERSGRTLNPQQRANLESTQRSIEQAYATILGKEDEKQLIIGQFQQDLDRFRHLRQGAARSANADSVKQSEIPDLVDTAVRCYDAAECGRLWAIAEQYARQHATTPVDLAAERIMLTAPPRQLRDVSITVSRLADDSGDSERIFMDVQCANFTEAKEFCRGPVVEAIRAGFRPALGVDTRANER